MNSAWVRQCALIAIFLGGAFAPAFAADTAVIPHRALWPESINSAAEFDRASRAEILVFARALADSEALSDDALRKQIGLDIADAASIRQVRRQLWNLLNQNYTAAAAGCSELEPFCPLNSDPGHLRRDAEDFSGVSVQPAYKAWFNDATQFQRSYLDELLRLAALMPRTNSEVETFNDNEMPGWEMRDRHFLLSFDDGPTRGGKNGGNTDLTLDMLRSNQINAAFFAVGDLFQVRLRNSSIAAMKNLYSGMCVGSHGWLHKSHAKWTQWQDSVASSSKLLHDSLPDSYVPAFRPPYGQRRPDSGPYFAGHGLKVVLWNIDSHDWDNGLTVEDVQQRVMSLMLLWRRGFILFHDFFPKAHQVVPRLVSWSAHDGVAWTDCHEIDWAGHTDPVNLSRHASSARH